MNLIQKINNTWEKLTHSKKSFDNSNSYWINRYVSGGNSGDGSYGELADFKAKTLNAFILEENINTVIEFGCGDGNQLNLANYKTYLGFDISPLAITTCKKLFRNDPSKSFKVINEYNDDRAELSLSLDVIFHLIEDSVFNDYMKRLFNSSSQFVIVFSSNTNENKEKQSPHVKHRKFTDWIIKNKSDWKLHQHIENKHPFRGNKRQVLLQTFTSSESRTYKYLNPLI